MIALMLRIPLLLVVTLSLFAQTAVPVGQTIFRNRVVGYRVIGGRAIFDGDIDLGPVSQMRDSIAPAGKAGEAQSGYASDTQLRWPNGAIPYTIDADIPNPQRIVSTRSAWLAASSLCAWTTCARRYRGARSATGRRRVLRIRIDHGVRPLSAGP